MNEKLDIVNWLHHRGYDIRHVHYVQKNAEFFVSPSPFPAILNEAFRDGIEERLEELSAMEDGMWFRLSEVTDDELMILRMIAGG